MKTKVMLPALAFVFAIGMSFATEKSTADPDNDWVGPLGNRIMIQEVDCEEGQNICEGQFQGDSQWHVIYDSATSVDPKRGVGELEEYLIPVL